jgi:hypothetical protein
VIPPKKGIVFDEDVRGERIKVSIEWIAGADNAIRLQLEAAFNYFKMSSAIGKSALEKAQVIARQTDNGQ